MDDLSSEMALLHKKIETACSFTLSLIGKNAFPYSAAVKWNPLCIS